MDNNHGDWPPMLTFIDDLKNLMGLLIKPAQDVAFVKGEIIPRMFSLVSPFLLIYLKVHNADLLKEFAMLGALSQLIAVRLESKIHDVRDCEQFLLELIDCLGVQMRAAVQNVSSGIVQDIVQDVVCALQYYVANKKIRKIQPSQMPFVRKMYGCEHMHIAVCRSGVMYANNEFGRTSETLDPFYNLSFRCQLYFPRQVALHNGSLECNYAFAVSRNFQAWGIGKRLPYNPRAALRLGNLLLWNASEDFRLQARVKRVILVQKYDNVIFVMRGGEVFSINQSSDSWKLPNGADLASLFQYDKFKSPYQLCSANWLYSYFMLSDKQHRRKDAFVGDEKLNELDEELCSQIRADLASKARPFLWFFPNIAIVQCSKGLFALCRTNNIYPSPALRNIFKEHFPHPKKIRSIASNGRDFVCIDGSYRLHMEIDKLRGAPNFNSKITAVKIRENDKRTIFTSKERRFRQVFVRDECEFRVLTLRGELIEMM